MLIHLGIKSLAFDARIHVNSIFLAKMVTLRHENVSSPRLLLALSVFVMNLHFLLSPPRAPWGCTSP